MTTDTQARPEPKKAKWQALVPLSVGRRGDRDKAADLVLRGEDIDLTEEESAQYLDRSRYPVTPIRPYSEHNEPMPEINARDMFGARGRPAPPAPIPGAAVALDVTDKTEVLREPGSPEARIADVADPDAGRDGAPVREQPRRGRPPRS